MLPPRTMQYDFQRKSVSCKLKVQFQGAQNLVLIGTRTISSQYVTVIEFHQILLRETGIFPQGKICEKYPQYLRVNLDGVFAITLQLHPLN